MKKTLLSLALIATLFFGACKKSTDEVAVANPTLVDTITGGRAVMVNATLQLNDTITGGAWSSSDPTIATVTQTGLVTGIKAGNAAITYTASINGANFSVYDSVTVSPNSIPVPIAGGNTVPVGTLIQLSDAYAGGTWTSSDPTIATIDQSGIVTGVAYGTVVITYTVNNEYANFTTTESLTVQ